MTIKRGVGILIPTMLLGGVLLWRLVDAGPATAADPAPTSSVPVTAEAAKIQDVPEFLNGLGTVQPLNVVQVKAQVNGTLVSLPIAAGT